MPEEDNIEAPLTWGDTMRNMAVNAEAVTAAVRGWTFDFVTENPPPVEVSEYRPGISPRGRIRCVCERCTSRRDRGLSTMYEHRVRAEGDEQERYQNEAIACADEACEVVATRAEMREFGSQWYCHTHIHLCDYCGRTNTRANMSEVQRHGTTRRGRYCNSCTAHCAECNVHIPQNDVRRAYDSSDTFCPSHVRVCDDCGHYMRRRGDCQRCYNTLTGLNGYGKTHAERWLGGPLPKNKKGVERGYYLGFELEVSATRGNVRVLHDWAEAHLGYSDALDCKEDSSVRGFEIATQPMTPQFFESVDWDTFFGVLNKKFPLKDRKRTEPEGHGLHVHIGRTAFAGDDIAMAAFCYLIGQSSHLERIARRKPTSYCTKVNKPVSAAIRSVRNTSGKYRVQADRAAMAGVYVDRSAINLLNGNTIEIRAFRSTRKPQDLKDAVRLVYVAAEYIRYLRFSNVGVPPRALHWNEFAKWVGTNYPDAYESIADARKRKLPVKRG